MRSYNVLFEKWAEIEPTPVDQQLIFQCSADCYVPLDTLLAQYKWSVMNHSKCEEYNVLRQYVVTIFGEQVVKDLEAMYAN